MKKRTILAIALAFCLLAVVATPALAAVAADGVGANAPKDTPAGTPVDNVKASTGAATIDKAAGAADFLTTGDDDTIPMATDTGGADINVWAKVIDSSSKIYKVDIAWGAMKFEFTSGSGLWDTTSHTYTGSGDAGWTESYVNGDNNKIDVTNHSNNAIDASFAYAMEGQPFNANSGGVDNVVGSFFADKDAAKTGATQLTGTATVTGALADPKISLATADAYDATAAGARTDSMFFAFSGKPDEGKGATLSNFTKVGVITVTVEPNLSADLNS